MQILLRVALISHFSYLLLRNTFIINVHHLSRSWDTNGGGPPWSVSSSTTFSRIKNLYNHFYTASENFTGEKGKGGMADPVKDKGKRNVANAAEEARDFGKGWKINPFIIINSGETITIAEMEGPGPIQQIWMTPTGNRQFFIFRFIGMMKLRLR